MKNKENQRIALTKRLLKEHLLRLMTEKSLQKITVSELCNSAEINRSTFYNHYSCPSDILKEIEYEIFSDLDEIWQKENGNQNWTLDKRVEALCSYLQQRKDLIKILFNDCDTDSEFAILLFKASHVESILEQMYPFAKDENSRKLMFTFITHGTFYMIKQWIVEEIPRTPKEMGELAYQVATQGWEK
ncbi:MAG: TetR/AcrR family transcriptional regulator [Treponema sp.]